MNALESYSMPRFENGATSAVVPNHSEKSDAFINILVADDIPGVLEIVTAVLDRAGYHVTGAEDGEVAWDALCAGRFDLLITDHDMPRLTGMELLRRMRAFPFSIPVILMSGRIPYEEGDLVELLQPGMILAKPFSFVDLLSNVSSVLAQTSRVEPDGVGRMLHDFDPNPSTPMAKGLEAQVRLPVRRLIGAN